VLDRILDNFIFLIFVTLFSGILTAFFFFGIWKSLQKIETYNKIQAANFLHYAKTDFQKKLIAENFGIKLNEQKPKKETKQEVKKTQG